MDKTEEKINYSKKYLLFLKEETGISINKLDILKEMDYLSKYKSDPEEFEIGYRALYKKVLKEVGPQLTKANLSRFFDNKGFENQTDLENFNLYLKRIDKAMLGMLIETCFKEDFKNVDFSKFILGGMNSAQVMDAIEYEKIAPQTRSHLYDTYLSKNKDQDNIEMHREKLENASINTFAYIKKLTKKEKLSQEAKKEFTTGLIPYISPLYKKVNEDQTKMGNVQRKLSKEGKENKQVMSYIEETLCEFTGLSSREIKKELTKDSINDIPPVMKDIKYQFIKEDYAKKMKEQFIKEYNMQVERSKKLMSKEAQAEKVTIDIEKDEMNNKIEETSFQNQLTKENNIEVNR